MTTGATHRGTKLVILASGLLTALLASILTVAGLELVLRVWVLMGGRPQSADIAQAEQARLALRRMEPTLAVPYADRIFELRPGGRQVFRGEDFAIGMTINSRRLRDREHSLTKASGTYRILALGDSFTFGWGVEVADTWWAELGRLMAQRMAPTPVEVINLGVYDYTFDQQVQRFQEFGLLYHPDLIVADFYYAHVATIATHVYRPQISKSWPQILDSTIYVDDEGLLRFGQPLPWEGLRLRLLLADFILSRVRRVQYAYSEAGRLNEFELLKPERQRDFDHAWALTTRAYGTLMRFARADEIPLFVFEIPRDMQVWPRWKKYGRELASQAPFQSRLPQQRFGRICQDLSMDCLDLLPRLAQYAARDPEKPLFFAVDVHLTARGQRLVGQIVFDYLASRGFVGARRAAAVR